MATYLGKQKIGVIVPVEFGGKYNIESVELDTNTQHLKIKTTDEDINTTINTDLEITKVTLDSVDIPVAKPKEPNLITKLVNQNGTYNASDDSVDGYSSVEVNVPDIDLSQTTATADDVLEGKEFYNASGNKVTGTYKDMLQTRVDIARSARALCMYCETISDFSFLEKLNFSGITNASFMFAYCPKLAKFPNIDTSGFQNMENFLYCQTGGTSGNQNRVLTEISLNIENATSLKYLLHENVALKTVSLTGGTKCTNYQGAFSGCVALETVGVIDVRSVTGSYLSSMFNNCTNLTNLTIKNIRVNLTIGSGTTYGHLLTLESLLNTIQELWIRTGTQSRTLTIGSANIAKLENVYVKLIDITDEMRTVDEFIDKKAPFVVCESTDEGAMLITEYVTTVKKWKLA